MGWLMGSVGSMGIREELFIEHLMCAMQMEQACPVFQVMVQEEDETPVTALSTEWTEQ